MGQATFEDYRQEVSNWVANHRDFVTNDIAFELSINTPHEWRPNGTVEKGILLIHGLGDSPWSFFDIAPILAENGFLVRVILLPGGGTNPEDLIDITADDWRDVVAEQARIMQKEVPKLYLGGFSLGANLALEYAFDHPEIAGLILYSPAIRAAVPFDFLAPLVSIFSDWVIEPNDNRPNKDAMRYHVVPTNAFAQLSYISSSVRDRLKEEPFTRPVVITLSEHDSVLDVQYILERFEISFTNPKSRLIYYGSPSQGLSERVYFFPDRVPEWRISSFSHMASMFSPSNEYYGFNGKVPYCANGQSEQDYQKCMQGAQVWYSAWGYREPNKIHARLTFNPYFDLQTEIILSVLETAD
ncbi:MAG: alpha/beta fold hydrolase [Deltaproteobacteria bacterium]|jgi:esterase/lipase|nr:alpha/beta fold hydrolase [Deltaproteobacteria bacterium]